MTRRLSTFVVLFMLSLIPRASAQEINAYPAPLGDFKLVGSVDYPRVDGTSMHSRSQDLIIGGWETECRSGLQPYSQRLGSFGVNFNAFGQNFTPTKSFLFTGERADVPLYFAAIGQCPAVGSATGYSIIIPKDQLPVPGVYTLAVVWTTWDGAGRLLQRTQFRTVTITP